MNKDTTMESDPSKTEHGQPPPPPGTPERPNQHDLMRKDLPKQDVADALDDFDGDEN
jgi:hypothetical protein